MDRFRLSMNLADESLCTAVNEAVLAEGSRRARADTLAIVDPTEARKELGCRMKYISRVRDASRSSKEDGSAEGYLSRPGRIGVEIGVS